MTSNKTEERRNEANAKRAERISVLDLLAPIGHSPADVRLLVERVMDKNPDASQAQIYQLCLTEFAHRKFIGGILTGAITNALMEIVHDAKGDMLGLVPKAEE
jgi:hypothetical protein